MHLSHDQIDRFYGIWKSLLIYVNRHKRLISGLSDRPCDLTIHPRDAMVLRNVLWKDSALRAAYRAENPDGLAPQDIAIVESWEDRQAGMFFIIKQLRPHAIVLDSRSPTTCYGVLGISDPLTLSVPFIPCMAEGVLLPWEDKIIYDSLLVTKSVHFGPGYRSSFNESYKEAKRARKIVTSLPAPPDRSEWGAPPSAAAAPRSSQERSGRSSRS